MRPTSRHAMLLWAALVLAGAGGCRHVAAPKAEEKEVPEVVIAHPRRTSIRWTVRQPGSIEAYEETPIVPRISGYVERWDVDIGDRVKKGQELARLWVPDLVAQLERRKAEVEQARRMLEVAEAHMASTAAAVDEARAVVGQSRANLGYREAQHGRVNQLLSRAVVNKEVDDEVTSQVRSAAASVSESEAKVLRAEADRRESEAARNKGRVDIDVAEAALAEMRAMVGYATLTAPFDGVVSRRTINTGDFVQPAGGAAQEPLYVIQRRDLMRVFVEVPEADAVWVREGTPAHIRIPILPGRAFEGTVRRTSYAVRRQTRTLLAEVDLPNPEDLLRPGLYASAELRVERAGLLTLPKSAVATEGDVNEGYRDYCYVVEGDKLRRMPVEVGARGEDRVEVLRKQVEGAWADLRGDEAVVADGIDSLADGLAVRVKPAAAVADVREPSPRRD